MSKPRTIIPIQAIDFGAARRTVEEFSAERNIPTHVYPSTAPVSEQPSTGRGGAKPAPTPRAPSRKFTVELPDYVIDAIQARTYQSKPKRTARYVVLEGLRTLGIAVDDADMVLDGRRNPEHP
jgi:hypothetical protein